jgi:hypothetical protein
MYHQLFLELPYVKYIISNTILQHGIFLTSLGNAQYQNISIYIGFSFFPCETERGKWWCPLQSAMLFGYDFYTIILKILENQRVNIFTLFTREIGEVSH